MAKQITFVYEGNDYTLEYTRASVKEMERRGFVSSQLVDKPMTVLPELFAGAFLANHRYLRKEIIEKIFENLDDRSELMGKLIEMYNDPIEQMLEGPTEGNVKWEGNW